MFCNSSLPYSRNNLNDTHHETLKNSQSDPSHVNHPCLLLSLYADHHSPKQPTHLLVVPEAGVAGDGEEPQQVHAVVLVLPAHPPLQQGLPVVVVPAMEMGPRRSV